MIFSKQIMYCNTCGKELSTDFSKYEGRFCNSTCSEEFNWRKTLSMLGKPYRDHHSKVCDAKQEIKRCIID